MATFVNSIKASLKSCFTGKWIMDTAASTGLVKPDTYNGTLRENLRMVEKCAEILAITAHC